MSYTDYLRKTEIKTSDYLRLISELVSANNDVKNRLDRASRFVKIIQTRLAIPVQHEVAVGILAVLFCHSTMYGKVPFRRLKLKMGLLDLLNPLVVEDFNYLLNEKYIMLEKSVGNIEYISITNKLYNQIRQDMTEENRKLFMMVSGKRLTAGQLNFFKSQLFNEGLDIGELFLTAVSCGQFETAKAILDFGWDMNKEHEIMAHELFICSQFYTSSVFCVGFYLAHGLQITQALIDEVLKIAEEHQDDFEYENTERLVEELRKEIANE